MKYFFLILLSSLFIFSTAAAADASSFNVRYEWVGSDLKISWDKVADAKNYRIDILDKDGTSSSGTIADPANEYSFSGYTKDNLVSVTVTAIDASGKELASKVITDFSSGSGTGTPPGSGTGSSGGLGLIGPIPIPDFTQGLNLGRVFQIIINVFLDFASVVAVISIIFSGYQYITSVGNPDNTAKAKANLLWSIIGLIIVWASFLIITFIAKSIGASG